MNTLRTPQAQATSTVAPGENPKAEARSWLAGVIGGLERLQELFPAELARVLPVARWLLDLVERAPDDDAPAPEPGDPRAGLQVLAILYDMRETLQLAHAELEQLPAGELRERIAGELARVKVQLKFAGVRIAGAVNDQLADDAVRAAAGETFPELDTDSWLAGGGGES